MKFKYYIVFAVLFIIAVGIYVYSLDSSSYTLSTPHQEQSLNLPVAIWVAIIMLIFFVLSLIFFLGEWIRGLISRYNDNKDLDKMIDQIINQTTKKIFTFPVYRNDRFRLLSKILARFEFKPNLDSAKSSCVKVDKLFDMYEQINRGNEQDLKKYSLSQDNEFYIKNIHNKVEKDLKFGLEVLKDNSTLDLKKYVFIQIAQKGTDKEIQKALELCRSFLDKEMLRELFLAYSQSRVTLTRENIADLCQKADYKANNYLRLAKESKPFVSPDFWLSVFEYMADRNEEAEKSYLYVLLDLEMIERVRERLGRHSKNEFLIVEAYLELKKMGKNYPLDTFFTLDV